MQVDVAHHVGAAVRRVEDREHEGKPARVVVASRSYSTDIEDAWDALTNAERIPRWFLPISGELKLGGRYQLEGNAGGTIQECDPPKRLAVTWEFGGGMGWVIVRLNEEGPESTRLELEHIAPRDGPALEFWDQYGPGAVGVGWDLALIGLDRHLETGAPVDRAEFEAWSISDEGKAFAKASSEDWGRASVAFGTDEAAAHAAADRTTAFYTGGEHKD